jgi:hypothetical protein
MLLVLGLKGLVYDNTNRNVIEEFYPDNLLLKLPDYTDPQNLDEILSEMVREWFSDEERKKEFGKMLPKKINTDYYVTNIMLGGHIYSSEDSAYRSIFDSIGIIYAT